MIRPAATSRRRIAEHGQQEGYRRICASKSVLLSWLVIEPSSSTALAYYRIHVPSFRDRRRTIDNVGDPKR